MQSVLFYCKIHNIKTIVKDFISYKDFIMANCTTAFGTYRFFFPATISSSECQRFLNALNQLLDNDDYSTVLDLHDYELNKKLDSTSHHEEYGNIRGFTLNFNGIGCGQYLNNISWFNDDERLANLLQTVNGLRIVINYTDFDQFGYCFVGKGRALISVMDNDTIIKQHFESEDLNEETAIKYQITERLLTD